MAIYDILWYNADIDECSENTYQCSNGAECENTIGSYICHCRYGWTGTRCETGNIYFLTFLATILHQEHFFEVHNREEGQKFVNVNVNST